jgi:predicted amidohydrolase
MTTVALVQMRCEKGAVADHLDGIEAHVRAAAAPGPRGERATRD